MYVNNIQATVVEHWCNQPMYGGLARLLCAGLQGSDHQADSNYPAAHYTGTVDSLCTNSNPNLSPPAHCQHAHPTVQQVHITLHHARLTHPASLAALHGSCTSSAAAAVSTSVTNPLLLPGSASQLSDVHTEARQEEGEGGVRGRLRLRSSLSAAVPPFSSRMQFPHSPVVSPSPAHHPSSAPSTAKMAMPISSATYGSWGASIISTTWRIN